MNKKIPKTVMAIIASFLLTIPSCKSQEQDVEFPHELRPKSKAKLDSLYPHASGTIIYYKLDNTEKIYINCHCEETADQIILTFDTNGILLNQKICFDAIDSLPDTIKNYMKKNSSPMHEFAKDYMIKSIDKKGEISYGITTNGGSYMFWFKSSGEFINKELMPTGTQ